MKLLYKVIAVILALGILPVAVFAPIVKVVVASSALSLFSSSESNVALNDSYSIYELIKLTRPAEGEENGLDLKAVLESIPADIKDTLAAPFIAFLVFFALTIVTSIALIFIIIFSKKRKALMLTGILGLLFTLAMNIAFSRFSDPIVTGLVPITDLLKDSGLLSQFLGEGMAALGSIFMSLLSGQSSSLIEVRLLDLGSAYVFMLMIYGAGLVWTAANALVDWDR